MNIQGSASPSKEPPTFRKIPTMTGNGKGGEKKKVIHNDM